jgi:hypothetical protein
MAKERPTIRMEITMRASLKKGSVVDMEYLHSIKRISMRASGRMALSMEAADCFDLESCSLKGGSRMD